MCSFLPGSLVNPALPPLVAIGGVARDFHLLEPQSPLVALQWVRLCVIFIVFLTGIDYLFGINTLAAKVLSSLL